MKTASLFADLILVVHAGYALFVVGGLVLILAGWARGWRWTRSPVFRYLHLLAILVVVIEAVLGEACPLTVWEDALRRDAGQAGYEASFMAHWVGRFLYYSAPGWVFTLIYTVFAAIVVVTLRFYPPQPRRVAKRPNGS